METEKTNKIKKIKQEKKSYYEIDEIIQRYLQAIRDGCFKENKVFPSDNKNDKLMITVLDDIKKNIERLDLVLIERKYLKKLEAEEEEEEDNELCTCGHMFKGHYSNDGGHSVHCEQCDCKEFIGTEEYEEEGKKTIKCKLCGKKHKINLDTFVWDEGNPYCKGCYLMKKREEE